MLERYFLHMALVLPCSPLLFLQAKRIRRNIPVLPDAIEPEGVVDIGANESLRLVILGESTVAGMGVEKHEDGLSGNIAKLLSTGLNRNVSWKAYGRSGYSAKKIYQETLQEMTDEKVDFIAIGLGGNDAFELNTPWGWQKDTGTLLRALHEKYPEARIAFMHLPPIKDGTAFTPQLKWALGKLVEIFGDALDEEIRKHPYASFHHQIMNLDTWNGRIGKKLPPEAFFSDGVHPSKLHFELWAEDFSNWVIENGIVDHDVPLHDNPDDKKEEEELSLGAKIILLFILKAVVLIVGGFLINWMESLF